MPPKDYYSIFGNTDYTKFLPQGDGNYTAPTSTTYVQSKQYIKPFEQVQQEAIEAEERKRQEDERTRQEIIAHRGVIKADKRTDYQKKIDTARTQFDEMTKNGVQTPFWFQTNENQNPVVKGNVNSKIQAVKNANAAARAAVENAALDLVGAGLGTAAKALYFSDLPVMQYARYVGGKIKYGKDVQLPTLYRKFVSTLPEIKNGKMLVSPINSRFEYASGEASPLITNFTTDVPVRRHGNGNWDMGYTIAINGKKLLGKRVVSTRPSDTFTFGDKIQIKPEDIIGFSGDPRTLKDMLGKIKQFSNSTVKQSYKNAGVSSGLTKADYSQYAKDIESLTREKIKPPTLKDYQFMDYVFRPKYKSDVIPKLNLEKTTIREALEKYPQIGEWSRDYRNARYLENLNNWVNVMYDPATPAESLFRTEMGIVKK